MSYQVLARKWRPKTFSELMGQEHVVTVLTNALEQQRLHHAYLFTGTRGVGKTTIARIFAKSLNCEQGITVEPCGKCDACVDIDQGRFVDLLEIDAASRTKVDDTREILDNVQYAPTRGRYKVYLIDEVHMLSRSSFNALLKTLEEPPEHVKFILATTDPQKLPVTVLSRCLQFHLKALSVKQIEQQLVTILDAENVTYEPLAISLLAKAARGSMRDSLSLTDQAIAQGQRNIIAQNVQQMLGGVDHNWVYKLLVLLIKQDSSALMALSLDIASYAPNYGRLMAELIQLLHQIAMTQVVKTHFDLSPEHNHLLEKFCQAMSPEDVQLYYQIVLNSRKDLPYAADEQAAFDMLMLRLLAFKPQREALVDDVDSTDKAVVDFDDITLPDKVKASSNDAESSKNSQQISVDEQAETSSPNIEAPVIAENSTGDSSSTHSDNLAAETRSALAEELTDIETLAAVEFEKSDINEVVDKPQHASTSVQASHEEEQEPSSSTSSKPASGIESILANRNMLRSRKKAMENDGKKLTDAAQRQDKQTAVAANAKRPENVPDIASITDDVFVPESIDPSVIKKANQVDRWANMIDAMALNGRLRQLALNATIDQHSTDDSLILLLNQSTKHLKSDVAHQQLQQFVSEYFNKNVVVDIQVVDNTIDDPRQIQAHINDKRYDYAKELLLNDDIVNALQTQFQAEIDEKTIIAR